MVDPVQDETYGTELDAFVSEDRTRPAAADGEGLGLLAERFEEDVAGTGEAPPRGDDAMFIICQDVLNLYSKGPAKKLH